MNKSKRLHIIKNNDMYYVYHKDFGNLTLMSEKTLNILNGINSEEEYDIREKKIIQELSDNFFVNTLENEEDKYKINEKENRRKAVDGRLLIGLQLIISNFCNFNCQYCFLNEEHKLRDNSESNKPSNMNMDVAKKSIDFMINNIKQNKNIILSIEFFGGEPLMNWQLIKQVLDLYKDGKEYGIEIEYTITTNGSLINDEIINYFEKYNISVIISFDSPNSRERIINGQNSLNDVLYPIFKKLEKKDIHKSFNSVISKYTLDNYTYKGLIEIAKEYGIQNIGLILDLDVELFKDKTKADDIVNLIIKTYYLGKKYGINVTGYWEKMYSQINNLDCTFIEKGYKACPAVGCKISVEPSGDIFACKCCPTKIGQIDRLDELLIGNGYLEYLDKVYKNSNECGECELEKFCSGVCVGTLEKKGSKYGKDNNLCYIYKKVTELLIKNTSKEDVSTVLL